MSEYNNEHTDYEPNFVMKDPEAPASPESASPSDTGGRPAETAPSQSPAQDYEQNVYEFIDLDKTQVFDSVSDFENEPIGQTATGNANTKVIGRMPEEAASSSDDSGEWSGMPNAETSEFSVPSGQSGPSTSSQQDGDTVYDPYSGGAFRDPRAGFGKRQAASADPDNGNVYNNFSSADDTTAEYEPPLERPVKKKKEKKPSQPVTLTRKSLALLMAAMMFIAVLFGGGSSVLANNLLDDHSGSPAASKTETTASSAYTLEDATDSKMSIAQITAATRDSVVSIRTESVASDSWMQQYVTEGAGSGVIISSDGYIMTNNHVIEDARKITVTTSDEKEYQAKLIGTDSTNDVAVIKIDASGLSAATYGNSDQINVGDLAVAIGNPLGELGGTVTSGIISALDRELSIDGKTMRLLQTDSSINPGNSGGGLFNDDGQLIGLVVAKSSGSGVEGLGFAIPINTAASVAQQLMDKGYVSGQAYTGMAYTESASQQSQGGLDEFFGGGQSEAGGVFIVEVNGKNAKAAGFQKGDMVYAIDGKVISTFEELSSIITSHKPRDKVTYTIVRDGMTKDISFELEEKTN